MVDIFVLRVCVAFVVIGEPYFIDSCWLYLLAVIHSIC